MTKQQSVPKSSTDKGEGANSAGAPQKAGIILTTLIVVAAVANLPLAMANVALPAIGTFFDASQTQLNLVAVGGIIVFGSLMGAMFLGQQFLQNVMGYSTVAAGAAILPAAVLMILVAPRSAKLVQEQGSRFTLLLSFAAVLIGAALIFFFYPKHDKEEELLQQYQLGNHSIEDSK